MKKGRIMAILLLSFSFGMLLLVPAKADKLRPSGYVLKNQPVKYYTVPKRHQRKQLKYHGTLKNQKKIYFMTSTFLVHGHKYGVFNSIGLTITKHATSYYNTPTMLSLLRGSKKFCAPLAKFRKIKTILSRRTVKRIPVSLITSKYAVWNRPPTTSIFSTGVRWQKYEQRTFFVTAQLRNRQQEYYQLVSKTGKKVGWVDSRAILKGSYSSPIAYLLKGYPQATTVRWVNAKEHQNKIVVAHEKQVSHIIVPNSHGAAIIIDMTPEGPTKFTKLKLNRQQTSAQTYHNGIKNDYLINTKYQPRQKEIVLSFYIQKSSGIIYSSKVKIDNNGKIVSFHTEDIGVSDEGMLD